MSIAEEFKALRSEPKSRILQIDLENGPALAYVWSLWDDGGIPLDRLIAPTEILSFAAKWYGDSDDQIIFASTYHDGYEEMISRAFELYNEADIVVTYNGKRHDNPHFETAFALQFGVPSSPFKDIDLYQVVKSNFKFQSNKLDFVAAQFGLGHKVKHRGFELWDKCMRGNPQEKADAWEEMKTYNIGDVILQEKLYTKIRPWVKSHPVVLPVDDGSLNCPRCGSSNLVTVGTVSTGVNSYPEYKCSNCKGWVRNTKKVSTNSHVRPL